MFHITICLPKNVHLITQKNFSNLFYNYNIQFSTYKLIKMLLNKNKYCTGSIIKLKNYSTKIFFRYLLQVSRQ